MRYSSAAPSALRLFASAIVLVLACFPAPGQTVKQHDFKTCSQSGFCGRHRAYADLVDIAPEHASPYELVSNSVKVSEKKGLVTANLVDPTRKVPFTFSINLLEKNTARIQIKEAKPLKPRYNEVADFTIETLPAGVPAFNSSQSDEEVRVTFGQGGQNQLVLHKKPFRFEWSVNGVPAVSFNERGYFYYEHTRKKEQTPAIENQAGADGEEVVADHEKEVKRLKEELTKDLWEESFGGKTDTKPNGECFRQEFSTIPHVIRCFHEGPTSIGFDLKFPGSQHVYGIPQHASSLALKSTRYGETYLTVCLLVPTRMPIGERIKNIMSLIASTTSMFSNTRWTVLWHYTEPSPS